MVSKQRLAENHVLGHPLVLTSHHCWKMVPHMKTTLAISEEPLLGSAQCAKLFMEYMQPKPPSPFPKSPCSEAHNVPGSPWNICSPSWFRKPVSYPQSAGM